MLLRLLLLLFSWSQLLQCRPDRATMTYVTGIWNIGRGQLRNNVRTFPYYKGEFAKILQLDVNMIIFG